MAKTETQSSRRKRQPPAPVPKSPKIPLLEGDGQPLESDWHVVQISLLDELVRQLWQGRYDFFCGGNIFIYYSIQQVESISKGHPLYKGPDFFVVKGVDGTQPRKYWAVWDEDGRYPDVIIELLSPMTAEKDTTYHKELYERVFRTAEYFWYDVDTRELKGFRLHEGRYAPIEPNERGWLWSSQLGAWLGVWEGEYHGRHYPWLRLYTAESELVPTHEEQAKRLAQRLRELGVDPETVK